MFDSFLFTLIWWAGCSCLRIGFVVRWFGAFYWLCLGLACLQVCLSVCGFGDAGCLPMALVSVGYLWRVLIASWHCCFVYGVALLVCFGGGLLGGGLLCVLVVSDLVLVGCGFRVVVFLFAVLLVWSLAWVAVVGCLLGVWLGAHAV